MERSMKFGIMCILILLTAFPLGMVNEKLVILSLIGCGFFGLLFWLESLNEEQRFLDDLDEIDEEEMMIENEMYYQKMNKKTFS